MKYILGFLLMFLVVFACISQLNNEKIFKSMQEQLDAIQIQTASDEWIQKTQSEILAEKLKKENKGG